MSMSGPDRAPRTWTARRSTADLRIAGAARRAALREADLADVGRQGLSVAKLAERAVPHPAEVVSHRLASFLEDRFTTDSERLSRPEFLDRNALANPSLAIDALHLELLRVSRLSREMVAAVVSGEGPIVQASRDEIGAIRLLIDQIESFVNQLELERLPLQPGDVPDTFADVDALVNDLGYRPNTSIEVGVRRFVDWYKDYYQVD